jgi:iron complex outermembrane receptor protein
VLIGAALFEQKRERTGGSSTSRSARATTCSSTSSTSRRTSTPTNYNRNFLFWGSNLLQGGHTARRPRSRLRDPEQHARQRLVLRCRGAIGGVYDQISRPNEKATSNYGAISGSYAVSDSLTFSGEIGTSEGHGKTPARTFPRQVTPAGTGASYTLHGLEAAPTSTSAAPIRRARRRRGSAGFSATKAWT